MFLSFCGKVPRDEGAAFVAPNATVQGLSLIHISGAPETADPEQELTLEQAAHRALEPVSYTHL